MTTLRASLGLVFAGLVAACGSGPADADAASEDSDLTASGSYRCARGHDDRDRAAALPPGSSELLTRIYEATSAFVDRGTVCRDVYATSGNRLDPKLHLDGPEIFSKMAAMIRGATSDVAFQTYVWEKDSEAARLVLDAVRDVAARRRESREQGSVAETPVTVRFLLDVSTVGMGSKKQYVDDLADALRALAIDSRDLAWEVAGYHHLAFGNLHVKTLVVDGAVAMITGANPQKHHDARGAEGKGPWRDSGYVVEGPAARAFVSDFDDAWVSDPTDVHAWNAAKKPDRKKVAHVVRSVAPSGSGSRVLFVSRERDTNPFGGRDDNTQDRAFLAAFAGAAHTVRVMTPNLNDDQAKRGLIQAAARGVRVDLVLSKGFNEGTEDKPGQGNGNSTNVRKLYEELASLHASGKLPKTPCELLRVRWYSAEANTSFCGNGDLASHAKYASIDGALAIVGTANQDTQSWNNSREVNLVVDDPAVTAAWDARMFVPDFERGIPAKECAGAVQETPCAGEDR